MQYIRVYELVLQGSSQAEIEDAEERIRKLDECVELTLTGEEDQDDDGNIIRSEVIDGK